MGCDIHIYIEYRDKLETALNQNTWASLYFDAINPGRNYDFFNKLSGVRGYNDVPIATSGWPKETSYAAGRGNQVYIREGEQTTDYSIDPETAKRWVDSGVSRYVQNKLGKNYAVTHPDWHSHGHCSVKEMSKALRGNTSPEYNAMIAAAKSLEKDGMEVRFLFYYDN